MEKPKIEYLTPSDKPDGFYKGNRQVQNIEDSDYLMLTKKMKDHSLNLWFIYFYWCDGLMWARWFSTGSGFTIKDIKKHPLLFSQRNKIKGHSGWQIGKWYFSKLKSSRNG